MSSNTDKVRFFYSDIHSYTCSMRGILDIDLRSLPLKRSFLMANSFTNRLLSITFVMVFFITDIFNLFLWLEISMSKFVYTKFHSPFLNKLNLLEVFNFLFTIAQVS